MRILLNFFFYDIILAIHKALFPIKEEGYLQVKVVFFQVSFLERVSKQKRKRR